VNIRATTARLLPLAALAMLPGVAGGLAPGTAGAEETAESLVLIRTSYLAGNRTEEDFVRCVSKKIRSGGKRPVIHAERQFVDDLYPWMEPRTMPRESADLGDFMARPGVADAIHRKGVRYLVWLSGQTLREGSGGGLSCAAGPGGAGFPAPARRPATASQPRSATTSTWTDRQGAKALRSRLSLPLHSGRRMNTSL